MASHKRHLIEPGRPYIHYDYEGDPEMPLEMENLTGGAAIFMRGHNTSYGYGKGTTYRAAALIKNNARPASEVKTLLRLVCSKGNQLPDKIFVIASTTAQADAIAVLLRRDIERELNLEYVEYGEREDGDLHTRAAWKAVLAFDPQEDPVVEMTSSSE